MQLLTERRRAMLRAMGVTLPPLRPTPEAAAAPMAATSTRVRSTPPSGEASAAVRPSATPASTKAIDDARRTPAAVSASPVASPDAGADASAATAEWLLVGEVLANSGDAGSDEQRLLDNMLRAVGLSRDPQAPRRVRYVAVGSGTQLELGEKPNVDDQRLAALIDAEVISPRLVLVLGRAAAAVALGVDQPLGALRGRVHAHDGQRVVVTFSLAYLLRHPAEKAKAWADLCLAVQTASDAASVLPT